MSFINLDAREKKALLNVYKRFWPLLFVAILIASLFISYLHFINQEKTVFEVQQKLIADAALDYNNYISDLTSIVRTIEVQYIELTAKEYSVDEIKNLFIDDMINNPTIDQLRILDVNGMETIRINKGDPEPYAVPDDELQDKSDRYYYQETKLLGRNQFLFSALDLNIEQNEIEIDPVTGLAKPTFRISTPIVIGEQRVGYFVVNFLMRDYLSDLRTSSNIKGATTLLFDEQGYMFNCLNEEYNFGFVYSEESDQHNKTISDLFTKIDLTKETGSFIEDDKICSYATFENIINLSKNYFLSENTSEKLYFMVYFDNQSEYKRYIRYSPLHSIRHSWKFQLTMISISIDTYLILIFLYFLNDRFRFVNIFSDHRYGKPQLKKALHNNEFINFYQPIINIKDGTIQGFEALSRWKHEGTVFTPDLFLEEINNFELDLELDENTFRKMRADRQKLKKLGLIDDAFFSINISRKTFENMIKENSKTTIKLTEPEKEFIVFELLEDIVIHQTSADKIREMHDQNIRFAIDDFGTGNSNIAFMRSFENMKVKIDKAFMPQDVNNKKECVIIESFVKMFVDQGLKLIAEGVETKEQYLYLKKLKVSGAQGYYFSKPLPMEELIEFLITKEYLKKL